MRSIDVQEVKLDGSIEFPAELHRLLPGEYGNPAAIPNLALDPYGEAYAINGSLSGFPPARGATLPSWFRPEFRQVAMFHDSGHRSGNVTLFRRARASETAPWPLVGEATANGWHALAVDGNCVARRRLDQAAELRPGLGLYRAAMMFGAGAALPPGPAILRVVAARDGAAQGPLGFVGWYPTRQEARAAWAEVNGRHAPPGLAGRMLTTLSDGRTGRDVLVEADKVRPGAVLVLYGFQPFHLTEVAVVAPVPAGRACDAEAASETTRTAASLRRATPELPLFAAPPPTKVRVGDPLKLLFTNAKTGKLAFFRRGKFIANQPFRNATQVSTRFSEPGQVGIEVWTNNDLGLPHAIAIQVYVTPR